MTCCCTQGPGGPWCEAARRSSHGAVMASKQICCSGRTALLCLPQRGMGVPGTCAACQTSHTEPSCCLPQAQASFTDWGAHLLGPPLVDDGSSSSHDAVAVPQQHVGVPGEEKAPIRGVPAAVAAKESSVLCCGIVVPRIMWATQPPAGTESCWPSTAPKSAGRQHASWQVPINSRTAPGICPRPDPACPRCNCLPTPGESCWACYSSRQQQPC